MADGLSALRPGSVHVLWAEHIALDRGTDEWCVEQLEVHLSAFTLGDASGNDGDERAQKQIAIRPNCFTA